MASKISSVFLKTVVDFNQFVKKYSNIISFLSLPIYAIFSWLIVRKKQLNYAQHLTMIVIAMAFGYTYNALVLLGLIIFKINTLGVASISLVLYLISFCITYKQCFDYKWHAALLKGTLVFLCSYITQVIILGIGLVIYFIILKSKS